VPLRRDTSLEVGLLDTILTFTRGEISVQIRSRIFAQLKDRIEGVLYVWKEYPRVLWLDY